MKTVVNGYEREGGLYLEHVCEKDTSGERVCERPPMDIHHVRVYVREKGCV